MKTSKRLPKSMHKATPYTGYQTSIQYQIVLLQDQPLTPHVIAYFHLAQSSPVINNAIAAIFQNTGARPLYQKTINTLIIAEK